MYDRATRDLILSHTQTGENLGPGAYNVQTGISEKYDAYAPFSSLTGRDLNLIDTETIGYPGPGQYDINVGKSRVGGQTLSNAAKRFLEQQDDLPGPGEYSVRVGSIFPKCHKVREGHPTKINYKRQFCAPAIPMPALAYGYEEEMDGTLKMQPPPDFDNTLGPAFYNPTTDNNLTTQLYKGNFWSKHSSGRTMSKRPVDVLPGPGEYEPFELPDDIPANINIKVKPVVTSVPRYFDQIVKTEAKSGPPGPGSYSMKSTFEIPKQAVDVDGLIVEHPPFGAQSRRFHERIGSGTPAPGTYNDPRTALDALKRIRGLKRVPFGKTSVRFTRSSGGNPTTTFNFPGLAAESMKKAFLHSTQKSAFGTSAPRLDDRRRKDTYQTPGPADYMDVMEKKQTSKYQQQLSSFSSKVAREIVPSQMKENPAIGSYNVDEAYKRTQEKRTPKPGRTADARKRRSQFNSTGSRENHYNGPIKPDPNVPAPNSYRTDVSQLKPQGGKFLERSKRFAEKTLAFDETPGPGAYEFSPLIQDTLLKGTFNATLNNPLADYRQLTASTRPRSLHTSIM